MNFIIILVLGFFLIRLTIKYNDLYVRNSLITLIVTNIVLYGISETLAQLVLLYRGESPAFAVSEPVALGGEDIIETDDEDVDTFLSFVQQPAPEPEEPLPNFRFGRLAGFMCWGFVMAIVQYIWYSFLQIYSKDPKLVEVIRKVLLDQFCFLPVLLFCFFTYGTMVLDNGTWDDTLDKLRRVYLSTLMLNYCVWFPVQFVNFLLVPRHFQVPFSSLVLVLWNCFLSMRNLTA